MALRFPKKSQQELAQIAIDNHLYVDGWDIFRHYESIKDMRRADYHLQIFVMFQGMTPVGACTVSDETRQIAVFVHPSVRGKGVGSKLIDRALSETGLKRNQVFAGIGESGSESFFKKNKIVSFETSGVPLSKEQTEDFINHVKSYKTLLIEEIQSRHKDVFGLTINREIIETKEASVRLKP